MHFKQIILHHVKLPTKLTAYRTKPLFPLNITAYVEEPARFTARQINRGKCQTSPTNSVHASSMGVDTRVTSPNPTRQGGGCRWPRRRRATSAEMMFYRNEHTGALARTDIRSHMSRSLRFRWKPLGWGVAKGYWIRVKTHISCAQILFWNRFLGVRKLETITRRNRMERDTFELVLGQEYHIKVLIAPRNALVLVELS